MATNYIWDFATDSYLMEKDDNGITTVVYTNEPVQYGKLISQRRGNDTNYYHFDGQGSTRQLTDQSGNVTDEYTYSAFGETVASSGAAENPFRYIGSLGYYWDLECDGIYVRARSTLQVLGRWLSCDPVGVSVANTNLYDYAARNPLRYVDPTGQWIVHALCGTACLGCVGVPLIGLATCYYGATDKRQFLDCWNGYWDSLPRWHKVLWGSACLGCGACLIKYAWPIVVAVVSPVIKACKRRGLKRPGGYRCGTFNMLCHAQLDPNGNYAKEEKECMSCYINCKRTSSWDFRKGVTGVPPGRFAEMRNLGKQKAANLR